MNRNYFLSAIRSLPESLSVETTNRLSCHYQSPYKKSPFFDFIHIKKRKNRQPPPHFDVYLSQAISCTSAEPQSIELAPDSRCVVFGDVLSAFHSLMRDLEELIAQNILDENYTFCSPNDYLVINGNLFLYSPYILETLALVLYLIKNNPRRIFYLKGNSEKDWKNTSLREELHYRINRAEIVQSIDAFFHVLPSALLLKSMDGCFNISYFPKVWSERVQGEILGEKSLFTYSPNKGLKQFPPQRTLTRWSLFSSPLPTFQEKLQHYDDSFAVLHRSTLCHYSQDVRKMEGFQKQEYPFVPTVSKLLAGCTLDLSKSSSVLGRRVRQGIYLGLQNTGIHPLFLDDEYTPMLAQRNIETFLKEYQTHLIFSPVGTPTTEAFYKNKECVIIFPHSGSSIFRDPKLKHIINFRTSYVNEAKSLIQYSLNTLKLSRFAVFYQHDSYGKSALEGARSSFQENGVDTWLETSYMRNNPNVEIAAKQILEFDPEVILFFSTPSPSETLIHLLSTQKVANKALMGISFLTDAFRQFLKEKGLTITLSRVTPPPFDQELEIACAYRLAKQKVYQEPSWTTESFEGFINAKLLDYFVEEIGRKVHPQAIVDRMTELKNKTLFGLTLNFLPQTRELSHQVWIDNDEEDWTLVI